MPARPQPQSVRSGDVTLAVREHSPAGPDRPTVVLVHGYPDRQDTWETLVARLPLDRWHVVTYDVRGAGASDAPADRSDYRMDRLVDDLVAVLDTVRPEGPVHLVGHDWGSVALWDAVRVEATDPRLRHRIASFTSISGPSLDHLATVLRRPRGRRGAVLWQALHSTYVLAFHVPRLPELLWSRGHRALSGQLTRLERLPRDHFGPGLRDDARHGLDLYRANVVPRLRDPRPVRTEVPVLVVRPTRDRYLGPLVQADLDRLGPHVRAVTVEAGHWAIVTHADEIAGLVREHVERG